MHCRLQEGHRRKKDMARLNTPLINHSSITIIFSQALVSFILEIMHPTGSSVHSTGGSYRNQRELEVKFRKES